MMTATNRGGVAKLCAKNVPSRCSYSVLIPSVAVETQQTI